MKSPSLNDLHGPFTLYSPDLKQSFLPRHYAGAFGCHGDNESPALAWMNPPEKTKSFAITLFDPDAPGKGFWHWLVYNISSTVDHLQAGAGDPSNAFLPAGARQAITDARTTGYFGPCPPKGERHRYVFTLYACREMLPDQDEKSPFVIEQALKKAAAGKANFEILGERG